MENNSKIKIMCMGDSITFGHKMPGSYRKFLYHNLLLKGHKIKMVGAKDNKISKYYYGKDNSNFFEYEDDNSGFSAYTICSFDRRKGLLELLHQNKCLKLNPNIIILLIGTNNIMENYDFNNTKNDFINLINYILNNIPKETMLFIGTIPDMDPNNKIVFKWFNNYRKENYDDNKIKKMVNDNVDKFNNEIKKIVENFKNNNYNNIRIENLNGAIKDIDKYLFDGVHPNNDGYKVMGEFWSEIVDNYLKEKNEYK